MAEFTKEQLQAMADRADEVIAQQREVNKKNKYVALNNPTTFWGTAARHGVEGAREVVSSFAGCMLANLATKALEDDE